MPPVYAGDMNARILERRRLESDLRFAIKNGELRLHFQPRYRLSDGQMVGAGDEFTVIIECIQGVDDVAAVADKLVKQVSSDQDSFPLGASIGIACLPESGNAIKDLMRAADSAMCEAKRRGKGQYRFHESGG